MRNYKLLLPNIASNFQRTELRSFLTNHFQSVSCVDAKEKKKRVSMLPFPSSLALSIALSISLSLSSSNITIQAAELKKQQTQKPEVHYADVRLQLQQ